MRLTEEQIEHLNPTEKRMATEDLRKLIIKYSIPTIISMFINALYNVVDRFWVGQIPNSGTDALSGVGLAMPLMTLGLGAAMLVGIGSAACISINLGKQNRDGAERILGNTLTLSIILSACMTAFGLCFKRPILLAVGASEATMPFADAYTTIILIGFVFQMISFSMNHPIRAAGDPKRFASTQLLGAVTNMILDPVLIIYFDMGVEGAAIATIFSMFLSSAWVFSYYFSKNSLLRLRKKYFILKKEAVSAIVSIGVSPCLMQVAASVVGFVINRELKIYGDAELGNGDIAIGAMTIINGVFALVLMPIFGINQGAQPIIGFNYGAGNYTRVKEAYRWSVIYAMVISAFGLLLVEIFAVGIVAAFNNKPELVTLGSFGMRIMISTLLLVGYQAPTVNFFTAIGRAKISVFLSLLRQVIVLIPMYIVLPIFFGLRGMWFAQPIADIAATVITFYYIKREMKMLKINLANP